MKKQTRFTITGAWYNDVETRDRSQVQDMLNKLAEESVRRREMVCFTTILLLLNLLVLHVKKARSLNTVERHSDVSGYNYCGGT